MEPDFTKLYDELNKLSRAVSANTEALHGNPSSGHDSGLLRRMAKMSDQIDELKHLLETAETRYQTERTVEQTIAAERARWLKIIGTLLAGGQGVQLIFTILEALQ